MTTSEPPSTNDSVWAAAMEHLAGAGDRLAALMAERDEPAGDVDGFVALLGATMDTYLNQVCADPDFPTFVPCCGYYQRLGSPNPDTVYRRAPVDPSGTYRITGELGTARQVTIMPFTARMGSSAPFDLAELTLDGDGRFDVTVGPERPADHRGDWWTIAPDTASLWLRVVSDDWGNEREPRVAIRRVDGPRRRPRPTPEPIAAKLAALGAIVEHTIFYGVRHTDELIADGFVNTMKLVDYGPQGAMPLQSYHEGVFELDDGEGLLLEATMPPGCDYFSFSLTDRMFVTLDWVHAPTTLNRHQAAPDADGMLRVVVAHDDPGIRNWMDTTGHRRGVVQLRFIGSVDAPTVTTSVVALDTVADALPHATRVIAEERERDLDARRVGGQLRSLW